VLHSSSLCLDEGTSVLSLLMLQAGALRKRPFCDCALELACLAHRAGVLSSLNAACGRCLGFGSTHCISGITRTLGVAAPTAS
jgi:hypothetical protein